MHDRIVHIKMLMAYSRSRDNIWKYGVKELKVILTLAWYISMNKSLWKRKMFFMLTHEIILIYYILLITSLYMSKIYIRLKNGINVYMCLYYSLWGNGFVIATKCKTNWYPIAGLASVKCIGFPRKWEEGICFCGQTGTL